MKYSILSKTTLTDLALAASVVMSNAALSLTNTSGNEWEMSFDAISFTANGAGNGDLDWLVFENFFSANSTEQGAYVAASGTLDYTINAGATINVTPTFAQGTFDQTLGGIDANDLFVNIAAAGNRPVPSNGDTVEVLGTFRFTSIDVPAFTAGGTVDATWYNNGGTATASSNTIAVAVVPEPSSAALLGLGGLALIMRRRK